MHRALFDEIVDLSSHLKRVRVVMVNATPRGGGVAEMLQSLIPLMRDVGLRASWHVIPPQKEFFEVTKQMHNALQGKQWDFPFEARSIYLRHTETSAKLMRDMRSDIWVIHDPQPAGIVAFLPVSPSILRIHIDLTTPNPAVYNFLAGFFPAYDRIVVSSKAFVHHEFRSRAEIICPAIDPLSAKNKIFPLTRARKIVKNVGINVRAPLMVQVSRFDPWKHPFGVLEAYRIAKKKIPDLQLAIAGIMLAQDDPEAIEIYKKLKRAVRRDRNIFLFASPEQTAGVSVDEFVNALQATADVVVQNSIREGFGLVVTEALWKQKAIVGGNAEGIRTQIRNGENGFIAHNPADMSEKLVRLLQNPALRKHFGRKGKEIVAKRFLIPRLLRDYLKLFHTILFSLPKKRDTKREELFKIFKLY